MSITLATGAALQAFGQKVIFTRKGDADNDLLGWRVALANDAGARAYVSIHCNSFTSSEARGVETFFATGSAKGARLAAVRSAWSVLNTFDRGTKAAGFSSSQPPQARQSLVECGFMSNAADLATLTKPARQLAIGGAIAAGVIDWLAGF